MSAQRTLGAALAGVLAVGAGVALAADSQVRVKGLGSAEVEWNAVRYREELVAQLAPGLTWRLGKDDATRLDLRGMALVCPQGGVLLPGEQTLNLRYWSDNRWELVVFEENRWKWGEDVTELGVFPASVGRQGPDAKGAKALDIDFRKTTRGEPTPIPRPAVTGEAENLAEIFEVPDDVPYPAELRRAFEALPLLELQMRFGPHVGTAGFEPVATRRLEARIDRDEREPLVFSLDTLDLPAPRVRQEYLEAHEGEIPVAVLRAEGLPSAGLVLSISGGEEPFLFTRTRSGEDTDDLLDGTREPSPPKKQATEVVSRLEGTSLLVDVGDWTYTFDLEALLDG